jgi:hypothetical protein
MDGGMTLDRVAAEVLSASAAFNSVVPLVSAPEESGGR